MEFPFTPAELGMPEKFTEFRPVQQKALNMLLESEQRFKVLVMPTGSGKSPTYIAYALMNGLRTCVLTSTKPLQDQLLTDFAECGMVDIRGRNNYQCSMSSAISCEQGRAINCPYRRTTNCPYKSQLELVKQSRLVTTNYVYWILANQASDSMGKFDVLILDEGHDTDQEIASAASVEITAKECHSYLNTHWPSDPDKIDSWQLWAEDQLPNVQSIIDRINARIKHGDSSIQTAEDSIKFDALLQKLMTIMSMEPSHKDWICHETKRGYSLDPLWASDHAERLLFLSVPEIVITSATMNKKTTKLLGIEDEEMAYMEFQSSFPPARSPLIHIPTARIVQSMSPTDIRMWLDRIDEILEARMDRKGIIHTVSYDRMDLLCQYSKHKNRLLPHSPQSHKQILAHFRNTPSNLVLITPSTTTGYDFPLSQCEFQIIAKIPFPDTRSPVMKARHKSDKQYTGYLMAQTLEQMCGRGMRSHEDHCENFLIDDQWFWVQTKFNKFFSTSFKRTWKRAKTLPPAPKSMLTEADEYKGSQLFYDLLDDDVPF
jgi:ATP-dependent DNA helicase DinG